jgi:uncharacterized protein (TIGR02001 family)
VVRKAVAVAAVLCVSQAHAQVSTSAAFVSDYRYRGVSLSDGLPAVQLSLSYDAPADGWYAGGTASNVRLARENGVQALGYVGISRRFSPELSWELGAEYTQYSGPHHYQYPEIYAGLSYRQISARVYYTNDYFSIGIPVLYAELNGSHNFTDRWYAFGHAGLLRRNGYPDDNVRVDYRVGMGLSLRPCEVQLAWTTVRGPEYVHYPVASGAGRDAWVLSVSYAW